MRLTFSVSCKGLFAGMLALLLLLTTSCAQRNTDPRTTEQSDGHGPGSAALPGSGSGMNQGHNRATTTPGSADSGKKSSGQQR